MKCQKIEKWTSDLIDGRLSWRKKQVLESHLKSCAACRAYKIHTENIHAEIKNLKAPTVSPDYAGEFSRRLKTKLSAVKQEERRVFLPRVRWKWAYTAAVFVLMVSVMLFFVFFPYKGANGGELYILSFEEAINHVYQEIGEDTELEDIFDSIVLTSIDDILEDTDWEAKSGFSDDFFFWEDLTSEELKFLEAEIKKEMKS